MRRRVPETVERAAARLAQFLISQALPVAEALLGEVGDGGRVGTGYFGWAGEAGADDGARRFVGAPQVAGHPGGVARQLARQTGEHGSIGTVAGHVLAAVDAALMVDRRVPHPPEAGRGGG